ncbi:MAG: hypothetical protein M8354_06460 [Halalkalicoccus sp.]|nr:hypothetical protein [Halalkalicoccus sp.]
MATRTNRSGLETLVRSLVAYRTVVYGGGLIAIGLPRVLRTAAGIEVAAPIRTLLVVASLGLMILTYLGERSADTEDAKPAPSRTTLASTSETEPEIGYSRRTRTTVAIGLAGIAIGIYVAIEVDTLVGLLFIGGGLLFGRSAYRSETEES